mmetsp:Transcript_99143/g.296284  ORF Transcript_99143/g.296284 Transcript_99143/m.296284 type:complete len:114 (+) Transcript_99143:246-587(+)
MTQIWSAPWTVERRWAMMSIVRRCFSNSSSSASWTWRSLAASRAAVASSSSKMAGSRTRALAMATRCFWPPLSACPLLPTSVPYWSGSLQMKACALAALAAVMICSSDADSLP